jgi:CheY-like chemotaxis protein
MISRKRILVVDDEPQITRVLRTVLTGAAMKSAPPKIVMRVCGWPGNGDRSDAALLDINMPGMSGIEAGRAIRRLSPRLPILMLTVRDSAEGQD